ncbi:MAG TPA: SIMPL domain-containing protein [Candidatus Acidoferrales bacterium]|nr:SIMPL domain-containing protein [Candidatus Acidoferrales bacterium]
MSILADTLVIQADGTYEADPDLATLVFDVTSQDKDMKVAYSKATQSMQRIVALANQNGLKKEDVSTGVLTLTPSWQKDRKNNAKSYTVSGEITLKVHDFSLIGPLLDGAVQEGIVDFRSLTYSLQDEESAKEHAVADAMRHAEGRATAALAQNGEKLGSARYVNLDVTQLIGVAAIQPAPTSAEEIGVLNGNLFKDKNLAGAPPPLPPAIMVPVEPGKISVTATVQCAFEIK